MNRHRFLTAAAAVLLAVAPAVAGGIDFEIRPSSERYTRDAEGKIHPTFTLENRGGCFSSVLIDADADGPGPAITVEKKDGDNWVAVAKPWVAERAARGQALGAKVAFRVDVGASLVVKRTGDLAAGTYRATVSGVFGEHRHSWETVSFTVVDAPGKKEN